MAHRPTEWRGSSVSYLMTPKDITGNTHFGWISIRKFLYCAFVHSSHPVHFDLFSKIVHSDLTIFNFVVMAVSIGMPYMCMDFFIKQYTRRLDFNEHMSPLLKGITISVLIQSTLWNLVHVRDAGDAVRYFFNSLTGHEVWSECQKGLNNTECFAPRELMQRCAAHDRFSMVLTSAHLNYVKQFVTHDRAITATRFFVTAIMWILNFFLSTIPGTSMLKFYKIVFLCKTITTILTLFILMISSDETMTALIQIMDFNSPTKLDDAISEVHLIFGVGMIGVYDIGSVSPHNMIDNTVIIFTVTYTFLAFLTSMFVRILYLGLSHCVDIDIQSVTSHYLHFALLPLSTELLYGQRLYTIYIYGHVSLTSVSYLTLFTFTTTKILRMQFRSVKDVYLVGLLCFFGFCVSVPLLLASSGSAIFNGLIFGIFPAALYLGGVRMAIVMWIYGVDKFSTDINFWLGYRPTKFWTMLWTILPAVLLVLCGKELFLLSNTDNNVHLILSFSWFILSVLISIAFQIKTVVYYVLRNNLLGAFRASKKYGPPDPEERLLRRTYNSAIYHRQCRHDCIILDEGIHCNHLPLMNPRRGVSSAASSNPSLTHIYEGEPAAAASEMILGEAHYN